MSSATRKLFKRLTSNRKQFGIMVALVLVAFVMWGKLLLKDSPRSASANSKGTKQTGDDDAPRLASDLLAVRPTVRVELSDQAGRDLFALNSQDFVKVQSTNVIAAPNSVPEKSDEARRAEILAKLKTAKVQSVFMRENPVAVVNDRLFHVGGEPVPGFTITRITENGVFLKPVDLNEEIELRMYRN